MIELRAERNEKHPVKVKKNKAEMKKEMKGKTENKGNKYNHTITSARKSPPQIPHEKIP